MPKNRLIFIIALVSAIVIITFLVHRWTFKKNDIVEPIEVIKDIPAKKVVINDSLTFVAKDALIALDKTTIIKLLDSLEKIAAKYAKLAPKTVIDFKQEQFYHAKVGIYQDSLSKLLDSLLILKETNKQVVYNDIVKNKKFQFSVKDKWFDEVGNFDLNGKLIIDSLQIRSHPYVIIGDKGKWYQKKTVSVIIGDHNPNIVNIDSVRTYTYIPKDKLQISFGPILLTNIKQTSVGVGVNFKKGIFSASLGYLLPIKN